VCNRYRLTHSKQYLAERFGAWDEIEDRPRYNIAPTQSVVTVRREMGTKSRRFTTMGWGLIPSWAKDMSIGTRTRNARSETITTTPASRQSILSKRCLIRADGFYAWQKMGPVKQPYCFEIGEGSLYALAGLWAEWKSPEGQIIGSRTILTTTPNSLIVDMHDRMPVMVPPDKRDLCLDPDVNDFEGIRDILKPPDANLMRRNPVSSKLNNSNIDHAESASPVRLETPTQERLFSQSIAGNKCFLTTPSLLSTGIRRLSELRHGHRPSASPLEVLG
jgi:putative SOS response-associated peptidase YedK